MDWHTERGVLTGPPLTEGSVGGPGATNRLIYIYIIIYYYYFLKKNQNKIKSVIVAPWSTVSNRGDDESEGLPPYPT